jgi:hypothetical protein
MFRKVSRTLFCVIVTSASALASADNLRDIY